MSAEQEFCVNLEIKSNGSRLVSGWTLFKFVLKGQEFVPYLLGAGDDHTPRGCLKIAGCQAAKLPFDVNDGKKYTFKLASDSTAYVFNASNEITRERVITLLNFASAVEQWYNPYSLTSIVELSDDVNEVSRSFFSSLHAKVAAKRIQGFFFGIRSKKRVARMAALYPELYLVSVNKVDVTAGKKELFAYVSGLVVKPAVHDIFHQPHKTTVPVCMASTPHITSANAFHVAIASYDSALSYLSVSLFDVADVGKDQQESLGIAYVPLSDVPRRRKGVEYTPYTTTLPLEPYTVPDLSVVLSNPTPPGSGPTSPPLSPLTATGHEHSPRDDDTHSVTSTLPEVEAVPFHNGNGNGNGDGEHTLGAKRPSITVGPSTLLRGASLRNAVSGTLTLTVLTPHPTYSMCGWLLKKSDTFMFGGSYRPYWFVLMNGELQYFQQQKGNTVLTLDVPKKLIQCQNITGVSVKNGVISISFKQKGAKGVWYVKIDPDHVRPHSATAPSLSPPVSPATSAKRFSMGGTAPHLTPAQTAAAAAAAVEDAKFAAMLERMWVRKLTRCSPNIADPDLKHAAEVGLFRAKGVNSRAVSTKTHNPTGTQHELVRTFAKERRPSVKVL